MTEDDVLELNLCWSEWNLELKPKTILLLSPSNEERELANKIFVDAKIFELGIGQFNLDTFTTIQQFVNCDVVIACNCFMRSTNVIVWLDNIHTISSNIWVQDLIRAWRNSDSELSPETGDIMRFCKPPEHLARIKNAFDLNTLGERLKKFITYNGKIGYRAHDKKEMDALKFVAWITAPQENKMLKQALTQNNIVSKNKKK